MQQLHPLVCPVERRNVVGDLEQTPGEIVPRSLVIRKRGVRPAYGCARQQFRVAQGVRNAVRGEGILEVPRVSHECPAGTDAPLDKSAMAAEPADGLHESRVLEPRGEE